MPKPPLLLLLFTLLALMTACAPDFQAEDGTYKTYLTEDIRNVTFGYRKAYYRMVDTAMWADIYAAADTVVKYPSGRPSADRKYRTDGIWYEMKAVHGEWRSWQQYNGFERRFDTIANDVNLMMTDRHYAAVDISAADIVLKGDSIRIAVVHETGPAYEFNFLDHVPQPDRLLLTTWGKDTMPIVQDLECLGVISKKTVFRVGKHHYVLRYVTPEYDGLIIEELDDPRGLPVTAEIDLTYKQVPVRDINDQPATIKRTPGRDLVIFFWGGFQGATSALRVDSLYRALPQVERDKLDIVLISFNQRPEDLRRFVDSNRVSLPVYRSTEKTCLRLNCSGYVPYAVLVDSRGRIRDFYLRSGLLEQRLRARSQVQGK